MKFYRINCESFISGITPQFNIYLFNSTNQSRIVELHANSPITDDHIEKWEKVEESGSFLQVYFEEKETALEELGLTEDDLFEMNKVQLSLAKLESDRKEKFSPLIDPKFNFKRELTYIYKSFDFKRLIDQARAEILCFPLCLSQDVTLATNLAQIILIRDNNINRQAAFAYFLAKAQGYNKIEDLADIVIGVFLKDLGSGLLKPSSIQSYLNRENEFNIDEWFAKHPMFSIYVAAKAKIDLSKRVKRIILEHHERADGKGFPRGKSENQLSPLSLVVHTTESVFNKLGNDKDIYKAMTKVAKSELPENAGISSEGLKATLGSLISSEEIENSQEKPLF